MDCRMDRACRDGIEVEYETYGNTEVRGFGGGGFG